MVTIKFTAKLTTILFWNRMLKHIFHTELGPEQVKSVAISEVRCFIQICRFSNTSYGPANINSLFSLLTDAEHDAERLWGFPEAYQAQCQLTDAGPVCEME